MISPAFLHLDTIVLAHPSRESKDIKYPPLGVVHVPIPSPSSSRFKISSTASNFGRRISAWYFICTIMPWIPPKNRTCLNWFTLSCPMVWIHSCFLISTRLFWEAAIAAIPDPGKLIFDVDANLYARSGFPALLHAARISKI